MDKKRIEGRTRRDEPAPQGEVVTFNRVGKCAGRAGEQRVLTWGDPAAARRREVSRGRSTVREPGAERRPLKLRNRNHSTRTGRTKPKANVPTTRRTPQPITPDGGEAVSACAMGSMGTIRSEP